MLRRWPIWRQAASKVEQAFAAALPASRAALLRPALQAALRDPCARPLASYLSAAQAYGWPERELEKLAVYGEFALGEGAQAFARIFDRRLAEDDPELAITALAEAYRAQRYDEAYALLATLDMRRFAGHADLPLLHIHSIQHTLAATGDVDQAIHAYEAAKSQVAAEKLFAVAYPLCFEAGWHDEADLLGRALPPAARLDEEHFAAGAVDLARDYYPEGFRLYESRYAMLEGQSVFPAALFSTPRWQGEPLDGYGLHVHGEQGLGDLVMMARYFPQLAAQATSISIGAPETAHALLVHNFPSCRFVALDDHRETGGKNLWIGAMSLPYMLRTTAYDTPGKNGYLTAPCEQRHYWAGRCAAAGRRQALRVGVAWSGYPGHRADRRRSVPFGLLAPFLRRWPNVDFYALQTAPAPERLSHLIEFGEELVTLADTAALIQELDLVISVDTSVVHLAGALGVTTWLMLPYRYEWRWSLTGERNAWYASVRVLRQTRAGDWLTLLERLGAELADWLAASGKKK